jgi:parvulin-like peptidyl-prolyl isomerase
VALFRISKLPAARRLTGAFLLGAMSIAFAPASFAVQQRPGGGSLSGLQPSSAPPALTPATSRPSPAPGLTAMPPADFDPAMFGEITSSTLPLENGKRIAMKINGEAVTWDDFIAHVRLIGAAVYEKHPGKEANIAAALEKPVEDAVVLQALYRDFAKKNRLLPEPREIEQATGAVISRQRGPSRSALRLLTPDQIKGMVADNLTREKVDKFIGDRATSATPTAAELTSFTEVVRPTTSPMTILRARHIVVRATPDMSEFNRNDARSRAEEIRGRLADGKTTVTAGTGGSTLDFATAARQYSQDRFTAFRGGDLGYFRAGTMYEAINKALDQLQPGQVSDVVQSPVGYHILHLTERHRDDLRLHYDKWLRQQAVQAWKVKAVQTARIERYLGE